MDQEDPVEKANPKLLRYVTPLIFAFPTSLAVAKNDFFEYDCTPWLAEPLQDLRLLWKIIDFASPYQREEDMAPPMVPLGTSSRVHLYAVFPHLKTIGKTAECRIFEKWHNDVIVPAFGEALRAAGPPDPEEYPPSHKIALLNSEAERVEMMRPDAPLTPIKTVVLKRNLPALWDAVVRKTTQPGFKKYADVFLVAVFDHLAVTSGAICVNLTNSETQEKSLTRAMEIWERNVDMRYVPRGRMEYRVESSWCI